MPIAILLLILFFASNFFGENLGCQKNKIVNKEQYDGVIINKYIDYEHSASQVFVTGKEKIIFANSWYDGKYYDLLLVGDTITKKTGQLFLEVIRGDSTFTLDLSFDCDSSRLGKKLNLRRTNLH